ncbi:Hint domain-containing protein [Actinocatenispora sera]|uniref:Hint domain-containing protein n=1 Tax=Actinocatenispora sera TaxID=390989 RepID=A0A810L677_9ACTN|nr:Hint domain-containing protein [Actinocatenispora sera]BCJ29821.1 hypothetical protein Asera_39290 [Actinocatenispora sera]
MPFDFGLSRPATLAPSNVVAEPSHGGGRPKGCNSFPGDTRVLLADGSTKPIAKIHIGDRVTNAKPDAHGTQKHRVDGVIRTTTDHDFVQITLKDGSGRQKITATAHHRFWDHTTHRWTEATNLKTGDRLQTTHRTSRITALTRYTKPQITYNLTIRSPHTYYVLAGNTPVLVHNAGGELGPGEVFLWRGVKGMERDDLLKNCVFKSTQGVKYFSFTERGSAEYARRAYAAYPKEGRNTMVRTKVNLADLPESARMAYTADVVDGGVALQDDVLPKLSRPQLMPSMGCG